MYQLLFDRSRSWRFARQPSSGSSANAPRRNSLSLFVTSVNPTTTACSAIQISASGDRDHHGRARLQTQNIYERQRIEYAQLFGIQSEIRVFSRGPFLPCRCRTQNGNF
jgi:hypothetical protein